MIQKIRKVNKETWLNLAPGYRDYNYRQSWEYGNACADRLNAVSEHIIIEDINENITGLANVRIKKILFVGGGIAYIHGGPLLIKGSNLDNNVLINAILALEKEYVLKRKLSLRIAPQPLDDIKRNIISKTLLSRGFEDIGKKEKTIFINLSLDLEEIRKNFHQKWRNCLNRAVKSNLTLSVGNENRLFQKFIPLFNEVLKKKKFSVKLDADFYANIHSRSNDIDKFMITLAESEGIPVAGHIASILGDTCVYLLGASNNVGRKLNAAYLLQWHVIEMAKAAGYCWYDLGGIDKLANPGVYRFKQRMGGHEVDIPGPFEMRSASVRGLLTQFGETIYRSLKPYLVRKDSMQVSSKSDLIKK